MSDCYINIRVGLYHLQLSRRWRVSVLRNEWHLGYPHGFFTVYEFWPFR